MTGDELTLLVLSALVIASGLYACLASWRMFRSDVEGFGEALEVGNPVLIKIAWGHVRSERNRLLTQLCFVVLGLLTLVGTQVAVIPAWVRVGTRFVSLIGIGLVYANSILNERTMREARRLLAEQIASDDAGEE